MSSKRSRVDEGPNEANTIPSVESLRREQHQQLLDTLTRLEAHHKQVVAESEKQINDLKRQNQQLRSENESLRAAARPATSDLSVASPEPKFLAQHFDEISKLALTLDLRVQTPTGREIETLFLLLSNDRRLANLKRFLQDPPQEPGLFPPRYCVDQIGKGEKSPLVSLETKGISCRAHKNEGYCVWITKRGVGWVIGSFT